MLTPLRNRRRAFSILRRRGWGGRRAAGAAGAQKTPRAAGRRARAARPRAGRRRAGAARHGSPAQSPPDHVAHRGRATASGSRGDPSTERRTQHKGVRRAGEQREEKGEQPHGAARRRTTASSDRARADAARSHLATRELRVGATRCTRGRRRRLVGQGGALFAKLVLCVGPGADLSRRLPATARDVKRLFFNNMPRPSRTTPPPSSGSTAPATPAPASPSSRRRERELRHIKWVLPDAPRRR